MTQFWIKSITTLMSFFIHKDRIVYSISPLCMTDCKDLRFPLRQVKRAIRVLVLLLISFMTSQSCSNMNESWASPWCKIFSKLRPMGFEEGASKRLGAKFECSVTANGSYASPPISFRNSSKLDFCFGVSFAFNFGASFYFFDFGGETFMFCSKL